MDEGPDDPELVVAPVTITPTKPLTPSHIKGLLWTDVLVKASRLVAKTQLVWNPRMAHLTTQTTAFWWYLDHTEPDTDWGAETEASIGGRYVRFHRDRPPVDVGDLDPYFDRVEHTGWIHPAGRRMLELWTAQFGQLNAANPGLTDTRPLRDTAATTLARLADRRLLIDHRRHGGPVLLDGARWGMPLRQLVSAHGHANYVLPLLRELLPLIRPGRIFVLLHDDALTSDYVLVDRVLAEFGAGVTRLPLSRVPTDGHGRSSKFGGWEGSTLGDIAATPDSVGLDAYRLGMRMYFVGTLNRGSTQPFRLDLLRRCVGRAARVLALGPAPDDRAPELHRPRGYVDPHHLTTSAVGPGPLPPPLRDVFL